MDLKGMCSIPKIQRDTVMVPVKSSSSYNAWGVRTVSERMKPAMAALQSARQ